MKRVLLLIMVFLLTLSTASAVESVSDSVSLGGTTTVTFKGSSITLSCNFFDASLPSVDLIVDGEMLYDTWVGDIWTDEGKGHEITIDGVDETAQKVYFSVVELCIAESSLDCFDEHVYWYDSCGERGEFFKSCGRDETCTEGECVSTCGNGVCESYEDGSTCEVDCGCALGKRECGGECVAEGGKSAGDMYDCEWECASQFGDNGRCVDPLTTILSASRSKLPVGETTSVTISLDSASSDEVDSNVVLTIDSGASFAAVESADSCTANLCKIFRKLPAKGLTKVSVQLTCESVGSVGISSKITYGAEEQANTFSDSITIECTGSSSGGNDNPGLFTRFFSWLRGLFS